MSKHFSGVSQIKPEVDFDLLAEVLDSIEDVFCVVDNLGRIRHENGAFREIVGHAHQERVREEMRQLARGVLFDGHGPAKLNGVYGARVAEFKIGHRGYRARASLMRKTLDDASPLVLITLEAFSTGVHQTLTARHRLTPREVQVVELLAEGHSNKSVAEALGVSAHTARHHTGRVLSKMQAKGRSEVGALLRRLHR